MQQVFYIFRHGKAIEDGQEYGDKVLTAALLPDGRESIKRLAVFLLDVPESINFSSEVLRCRQTAEIVTETTGKQFVFDSRLNEYHGVSFVDFREGMKHFLKEKCLESGTFLICTHAAGIAGIKHLLLSGTFEEKDQLDYTMPGELLIIKNREVEVMDFNK